MKHLNIIFLLFVLMSIISSKVQAHDIEVKNADGVTIYYNWMNNKTELSVSYRGASYDSYSNEYTGDVVIPASVTYNGKTYPVTSISAWAFAGCTGLTSITIPNSMKNIYDYAFSGCTSLTSITIPNSVKNIFDHAFSGCYFTQVNFINNTNQTSRNNWGATICEETKDGLLIQSNTIVKCRPQATSVTIPNSVKSISDNAFQDCTNLNVVNRIMDITTWCEADPITYGNNRSNPMYYAKELHLYKDNGTEITDLVIPNEVTSIRSSAFSKCVGLKSVTVPNSVKSISDNAFQGCTNLNVVNRIMDITTWCEADPITYGNIYSNPMYYAKELHLYKDNGTEITDLVIPNEVTSIRSGAFSKCISIKSVTIPNSMIFIGSSAFNGCMSLSNITIPNSVTSIGSSAFDGCTALSNVRIDDGENALKFSDTNNDKTFSNSSITTLYLGRNLSYQYSPFGNFNTLKDVTIGNNVTSIGSSAFSGCKGLKNVKIEDGEGLLNIYGDSYEKLPFNGSSIGSLYIGRNISYGNSYFPFQEIGTLKKVTIGSKVTSLGSVPFWYCTDITSIVVDPSNTTYDSRDNCNAIIETSTNTLIAGCENTIIPKSVIKIGNIAFSGRKGLTSFIIPNHVMEIGIDAFYSCENLINVKIEDGDSILKLSDTKTSSYYGYGTFANSPITSLYLGRNYTCQYSPFSELKTLKDVTIGNNVTSIGESTFYGCVGLTSVEMMSNGVISIGKYAFYGCTGLKNISIPNSVTCIDDYAFRDCTGLISLSDNITSIGKYVFSDNSKLLVNKGTKTLLYIWNENKNNKRGYVPYDKETNEVLTTPELSAEDITQTTATIKVSNIDMKDGYTYSINNEVITNTVVKFSKLKPGSTQQFNLVVTKDDIHYDVTGNFTTKGMNLNIEYGNKMTASSIHAIGSYLEEDAKVVAQRMYILNKPTEGNECFATGLNPGRSYTIVNEVDVEYGGEALATCRTAKNMSPVRLKFNVAQPKVVSQGNAIVSATVNLDPEEENIGFEWRRTDWTDEFPSNTGQAYLYEGVIEGYIKNLNTDKLWKFRPYYLSDDGTYHYGDWMGLDPTNTSYFEPTVHTYARINIEGNTALVRGYALAGTENIKVQGFKYWKTSQGSNASHQAPSIPANAKTIVATGQQIITATLAALDYNSTYHYVAFVTTEDGTTYYGEEQVFTTPMAPAGIDDVIVDTPTTTKKGVYTLTGVKLADDLSKLQGLS